MCNLYVPPSSTKVAQAPSFVGSKSKGIHENKVAKYFDISEPMLRLINFRSHRLFKLRRKGLTVVQRQECKVISLQGKRRISLSSEEWGSLVTIVNLHECYRYVCSSSCGVS
jgi:hypothetical protein